MDSRSVFLEGSDSEVFEDKRIDQEEERVAAAMDHGVVVPLKRRSQPRPPQHSSGKRLEKDALLLNQDIVSNIASFLDIKSLYNFSTCSKRCLEILRPDHVVKAALYHGGHAKTNVERMIEMIRTHRILVPSPLRFLRLCIGRRCECCHVKRVNFVSFFGVFFCKGCLENEGYVATIRRFDPMFSCVSNHFVVPDGCNTIKVWAKTHVDNHGEPCGPLLSVKTQGVDDPSDLPSTKVLKEKDAEKRKIYLPLIEKAYSEDLEPASKRILMEQAAKFMASQTAQQKKIRRIKFALQNLSRELGNVPWKREILAHRWVDFRNTQRLELLSPLARNILARELSVPSRLTKKRIKCLASLLSQAVELFEGQQLHDFSFFSSSCPEEIALRHMCLRIFPNYRLLSVPWVTSGLLQGFRSYPPDRRLRTLVSLVSTELANEIEG